MNRAIHAAVRRDLDRLERALTSLEDGDRGRVTELARAWGHLDRQLTHHHRQEDELIWPAMLGLGVDPVLLEEMEQEHQQMAAALRATDGAIERLAATAGKADAEAAAESVVATRAVVERHLRHEEHELEPEVARHHDTEAWRAVEKKLRGGSPRAGGEMFAWLLDGADREADSFVRSTMPRPVLLLLSRVLGAGYHRSIAPVWRVP